MKRLSMLLICILSFGYFKDLYSFELDTPKRLKIAFVIDSYDNPKSGGVMTAVRFVKKLREHHQVTILTSGSQKDDENRINFQGYYPPFFKNIMQRNGMVFALPDNDRLEDIISKVDVVYVHFPFLLGSRSIQIAKKLGKPVVAGFHVQPENMLMGIGVKSDTLTNLMYNHFINTIYNLSDIVICPSKFAEEILKNNKKFKSKTIVISNGIDHKFRPQELKPLPEFENKFVILSVGRFSREKRQKVLIRAVSKSKYAANIQVILAGSGPLKESLIEESKILQNKPEIGFVSDERLIRLLNTADLFVHSSEVELEGMSVLEAIGCGLPALISDSKTSAAKYFAIHRNFLFSHNDSIELAKKIDYWYEHQEKLFSMKKKYAKSAKQYYFKNSVSKMEDVFLNSVRVNASKGE